MTARGRELLLWKQFANAYEHQVSVLQSDKPHPAKSHTDMTVAIVGGYNLVGRQRHSQAVREEHERAWWPIADNR